MIFTESTEDQKETEKGRTGGGGGGGRGEMKRVDSQLPFRLLFFCIYLLLLYFYFCRNRYCLPDVNIFINAKDKQNQNGSQNYLDFCQSMYFDSFK